MKNRLVKCYIVILISFVFFHCAHPSRLVSADKQKGVLEQTPLLLDLTQSDEKIRQTADLQEGATRSIR